jgi:hypothetical protein
VYTIPFFPNRKNARNWVGIKIYIVALCWVGVTIFLPFIDAEIAITSNFYLISIHRFILVFVFILVFEIIDLAYDDPYLLTVPQQIGVRQTKWLGFILVVLFCGLGFYNANFKIQYPLLIIEFVIATLITLFLAFANEKRSKYYTSFWVESVPILWWLLLVLL